MPATGGNVLEFTPPLIIDDDDIDAGVAILRQAFDDVLDGASSRRGRRGVCRMVESDGMSSFSGRRRSQSISKICDYSAPSTRAATTRPESTRCRMVADRLASLGFEVTLIHRTLWRRSRGQATGNRHPAGDVARSCRHGIPKRYRGEPTDGCRRRRSSWTRHL